MLWARLRHVRWIGGGPGSGKSTIAERLADGHGLHRYSLDDVMGDHFRRTTPETAPLLHAFSAMSMDERWLHRSPEAMLESFHWFAGEGFDLVIEDLLARPPEPGIIVEGFRALPDLVAPLLSAPDQAVWLLPTPEFRHRAVSTRWSPPGEGFLEQTSDPVRAVRNLAERDRLFVARLREEVRRRGLRAITVDIDTTEDDTEQQVATALGL
jgi:cytidylate kinase